MHDKAASADASQASPAAPALAQDALGLFRAVRPLWPLSHRSIIVRFRIAIAGEGTRVSGMA